MRNFLDLAVHGPDGVTDLPGFVVIADELLGGPRSGVLQQAHTRLAVQMAVLYRQLGGGSARRH